MALAEEFIAILYHLVSSADEVDVVPLAELVDDVLAEGKADSTVILAPLVDLLVRVTPK